jgi:hypothetical protein
LKDFEGVLRETYFLLGQQGQRVDHRVILVDLGRANGDVNPEFERLEGVQLVGGAGHTFNNMTDAVECEYARLIRGARKGNLLMIASPFLQQGL